MAIPGSIVAVGKLVTPGGAQGPQGPMGSVNRLYNALGNPNFEIDQRKAGGSNLSSGLYPVDRWQYIRSGATAQLYSGQATSYAVVIPGTNFRIANCILNTQVQAAQASLSAGDIIYHVQNLEGPQIRELANDVFSISLLVYCNVAGLKFSVSIRDNPSTKSLVKLFTIPTANTWTIIQLPNIPAFPSGNFAADPGQLGALFTITLACGSTYIAPAADTWQSGNFVGAPGMSNFAATLNNQFLAAFAQMEPGPFCTQFQDKPFAQNYQECLRYYAKSYGYSVIPGAASVAGELFFLAPTGSTQFALGYASFPVPLAKDPPVVTIYNSVTGAINGAQAFPAGTNITGVSQSSNQKGISYINVAGMVAGSMYRFHYIADTGL